MLANAYTDPMNITLCDLSIQVDDAFGLFSAALDGSWSRSRGGKAKPPRYAPRVHELDRLALADQRKRQLALNHLVWWHETKHWITPTEGQVYHRNNDPLDFRFQNLEMRDLEEATRRILSVRSPPAVAEKGISELPNGQFKVRAYDPATKKPKYVGLRNTREEAIELKRQFLAGEATFGGDRSPRTLVW